MGYRGFEQAAGQDACLAFLSDLTSIVRKTQDESTKRIALACIDGIVERFGKKDIAAVIDATHTVTGANCLGAASEEMRITSLLSLTTIVEALRDDFVPFVPQALPKTLDLLNTAIEASDCSKRLHNAAYSFLSAVLLYTPWTVAGPDLDILLKVSHGSANTSMDDDWSTERRETLDLVAKHIDPRDCCAALERTWANAMGEGPEVFPRATMSPRYSEILIDRRPSKNN